MGFGTDSRSYMISANWDPTDPHFDVLNIETAKGWCWQDFADDFFKTLVHDKSIAEALN